MSNKERLLELISKKEEILSKPFKRDDVYVWLEEIYYLLSLIKSPHEIVEKIMITIKSLFYQELPEEKIIQLRAKLYIFEKYESEKLKIN